MPGGWQHSTRRERLPPDWKQRRARILARDGHRCTWIEHGARCPDPATDVDHVEPNDDHDDSNLRSLCQAHHRRKSSAEGNAARRKMPTARRDTPKHPGLN